jgi:hypothetical protein
MITIEALEQKLSSPGEHYKLDTERLAAVVLLKTVRVENGMGDPDELAELQQLLDEMRAEDDSSDLT